MADFMLPKLGLTMDEARFVRWLKSPGEPVRAGEPFAEIETDKAVLELEAPEDGVLAHQYVQEGDLVPVGAPVAAFADESRTVQSNPCPPREETESTSTVAPRIAPAVRRRARELGVDLEALLAEASSRRRITLADVEHAARPSGTAESGPVPTEFRPEMRRAIANQTAKSTTIPKFTVWAEVDAEPLAEIRTIVAPSIAERYGVKLTVTDFLLTAVMLALSEHLPFQRVWRDGRVMGLEPVRVGLAVAVDGGLLIPTFAVNPRATVVTVAQQRHEAVNRARAGRLPSAYLGPAVMSVSNLGMTRVDAFEALINADETAILAVGRIRPRPVVRDGAVMAGKVLSVALTCDHRVVDGMDAARFLESLVARLEGRQWALF